MTNTMKENQPWPRCHTMLEKHAHSLRMWQTLHCREPDTRFSQCGAPISTQHEVLGKQLSILILGEAVTSQLQPLQRLVLGQWCGHLVQQVQAQALQWSGDDSSMQTEMLTTGNLTCWRYALLLAQCLTHQERHIWGQYWGCHLHRWRVCTRSAQYPIWVHGNHSTTTLHV